MKKIVKITALIIVLFSVLNITAFANAGPGYSSGRDGIGMVTVFEDCPVVVEKEVLTFEIDSVPDINDLQDIWMADYKSRFVAEYSLYNPTEYDITTRLYFPFGNIPKYVNKYDENGQLVINMDKEKYSVAVDGVEVDKTIRHSYDVDKFDINTVLPQMLGGQVEDEFFYPEMPVTKYVYKVNYENPEDVDLSLSWVNENGERAITPSEGYGYYSVNGNNAMISIYPDENGLFEIYIFGMPLEKPLEFKNYSGSADNWKVDVQQISSVTQTLKEYINEKYREVGYKISENDWYNISIMDLQERFDRDRMVLGTFHNFILDNVLSWYEYEITIPASSRVTNTVTAPIYPTIYYDVNPYEYDYVYLLSPAEKWAGFENIEIYINTPFEMLESTLSAFEKTERGYKYTGNGLPKYELEFTLSTGEIMPEQVHPYTKFVTAGVLVFATIVFVVGWFMYHDVKRYEAKNGKFKG